MRIRVVLVAVAVLAAVVTPAAAHEPSPPLRTAASAASPALRVLDGWDTARATAWAAGDVPGLRRLYVAGSPTGRGDVGLLRRYLARGLVVTGMRRQRLAVRVVRSGPHRVVVRVTDRLVGAVAVSTGSRAPLPASAPRSWRLDLRSVAGRWVMASVRPTGPP